MADGIFKNIEVLREQARATREAIAGDFAIVREKWRAGERLSAIKTALMGPPAEIYQNAWRWIFFRDILLVGVVGYLLYLFLAGRLLIVFS